MAAIHAVFIAVFPRDNVAQNVTVQGTRHLVKGTLEPHGSLFIENSPMMPIKHKARVVGSGMALN